MAKQGKKPSQFYVLSKAKLVGARLEQSERKETHPEVFRQEMRRAQAKAIQMTEKVKDGGHFGDLLKLSVLVFIMNAPKQTENCFSLEQKMLAKMIPVICLSLF